MIVWLVSYPRSGNTLARILLKRAFGLESASIHGDRKDIAASESLARAVGHRDETLDAEVIARHRADADIHLIKSHDLPGGSMAPEDRFVHILRDGRDVVVSYFHYLRDFGANPPSSVEQVAAGAVTWGTWAAHVDAWTSAPFARRISVRYEDMVASPQAAIGQFAGFLEREPKTFAMPAFDELAALDSRFFRQGKAGGWENELTGEAEEAFWLHNGRTMQTHGYTDGIPELLRPVLDEGPLAAAVRTALKRARARLNDKEAQIKARNAQVSELRGEIEHLRAEPGASGAGRELEPVTGLRRTPGQALRLPAETIFWKTAEVAEMVVYCARPSCCLLLAYANARPPSIGEVAANGHTASFVLDHRSPRDIQFAAVRLPLEAGPNTVTLRSTEYVPEGDPAKDKRLYFPLLAAVPI